MQGPDEPRTLTQLKADNFTEAILGAGNHSGCAGAGGSDGTLTLPGNGIDAETGADAAAGPSSGIRAQVLVTVPVFPSWG
jgi:hypothetical protein